MWSFKITFDIPRDNSFDINIKEMNLGDFKIIICDGHGDIVPGDGSIYYGGRLAILGSGYESESKAKNVASKVACALLLTSMKLDLGVSFTADAWSGLGTCYLISKLKESYGKAVVVLDVLGVEVFESSRLFHFLKMRAQPRSLDFERFDSEFKSIIDSNLTIPESLFIPLILINSIFLERSLTSQFILSITTIEAIVGKPGKKSREEISAIDDVLEQLKKAGLEKECKDRLLNAIGNLKNKSIGNACRDMIEKHFGVEKMELFKKLYSVRSKIVHEGKREDIVNLYEYVDQAISLAKDLIDEKIREFQESLSKS
ncbi:hypothetical protein ACIPT4_19765 [Pectobacterium jejuense]|uniref:hypothetical protein n=1 Tax=Pectobacterium jejuense TaxID=2974022 RepID=UPI00380B7076